MPRAATATSRTAVNQRAYRKRIAVGVAISPAPCDGRVLDYLIKLGWLDEHDVFDRDKVGEAMLHSGDHAVHGTSRTSRNVRFCAAVGG
jgi:hypothetical protein